MMNSPSSKPSNIPSMAAAKKSVVGIMEHTLAYRVWQAPFAERKLAPVLRHNDLARVRRVLDVGCGPGINTRHFDGTGYLGLDFNERYIEYARARYAREFITADVTTYRVTESERFDFVLCNSLFHHIDTPNVSRILEHLATLLTEDGHVHILDLVLPKEPSIGRLLARLDRGDFPRPLDEWRKIFTASFEPVVFEQYPVGVAGVTLWNMIYFKGKARRHS
jgi:SAM-dependent methyltransferase